jgi:hypothetical protein
MLAALAAAALSAMALLAGSASAAVHVGGPRGAPLPAAFAGFSVETDTVGTWFSPGGCDSRTNKVLNLLGQPEIRVGGNSQDRLWPNSALPAGQHQVASAPYFHALNCLAATGSPLLVGLNLLGNDAVAAGDLLSAVETVVPPKQLSIAVGNEPNLYGGRLPAPRGYAGYLKLFGSTINALLARFGGHLPPLAGPDAATWRWKKETVHFIANAHPAVADVHLYGLNGCGAKVGKPGFPTVSKLLAPSGSTDLVDDVHNVAIAAHAAGITAQISEANTVACRGISGVSDGPASALWALSVLGTAVTDGFDRVQFHTANGNYDAFVLNPDGTVAFRPLMSAMLMADRLWPAGSLPEHFNGTLPPSVVASVARRPDGRLGVLLIDRDATHSRRVVLRTQATRAQIGTLRPAGAYAVTLNGQRLAWARGGPRWEGKSTVHTAHVHGGSLIVKLAPMTATWLQLSGHAD